MIVPVILSGGSGTRLWPLSRPQQPKQLLAMVDERTMLRATFDRLDGLPDAADPLVVCNSDHHHLVAAELDAAGFDKDRVILEPTGRNTAPAIAAAAILVAERHPTAILLVLPADHIIKDEAAFRQTVESGVVHAEAGRLVTFGIVPEYPETGYGYIRSGAALGDGAFELDQFVEKPDRTTAESYVADGRHLWNSGMFMFSARRYLEELERFQPEIVKATAIAVESADRRAGVRLDAASFAASPADSVDFAVMEHTANGVVVPMTAGWSDVGSWTALWQVAGGDEDGNVVVGDVTAIDTTGSYLRSESRLVAAIGLHDMVVVETPDAVLVAPRDQAQSVKDMVAGLQDADRSEVEHHQRRTTEYGLFENLLDAYAHGVHQITITPGSSRTTRHEHFAERWIIARGTGVINVGDGTKTLVAGDVVSLAAGVRHQIDNSGPEDLVVIVVRLGTFRDEDRVEDGPSIPDEN